MIKVIIILFMPILLTCSGRTNENLKTNTQDQKIEINEKDLQSLIHRNKDQDYFNFDINDYPNITNILILNSIIIPEEFDSYPFESKNIIKYWKPEKNDIIKCLQYLDKYIRIPNQEISKNPDFKNIMDNIKDFNAQVIGVIRTDNSKRIIFSFIMNKMEINNKNFMIIKDGGWKFWQTEIDVETGKVYYITINGYA